MKRRTEQDDISKEYIDGNAFYGINALRGQSLFAVSDDKVDAKLIETMAWVKKACTMANYDCGLLENTIVQAIITACEMISEGRYDEQFIVNTIQGGGGTSFNMNMNEVIANVALKILGYEKGRYDIVDPLKHVNLSQSTNDTYPTAINMALFDKLDGLLSVINDFNQALRNKSREFSGIFRIGRTHLNSALPITYEQNFNAYFSMFERDYERIRRVRSDLLVVPLGGTMIGTGSGASDEYRQKVIEHLRKISGLDVRACANLSDGIQNVDIYATLSSALKILALNLSKMASDLRLMSADWHDDGERLSLPRQQLGSSFMPSKTNPVMPELVNQVSFMVCGYDTAISIAAQAGQLELNVFKPLISHCLFKSIDMMANAIGLFGRFCIEGLMENESNLRLFFEHKV